MNFYNKKFRKIVSMVVIVMVTVMVATSILPYML